MNNVWVKIKEINELCGAVNFSSHNQMREAIEGTMEITETLLSEQPSQSNVSEDVEKAAEDKIPVYPIYADFLENLNWQGYINHLRISFKDGAEWQKQQDNSVIGFAEWISDNAYSQYYGKRDNYKKWYRRSLVDYREFITTKELYNIYLKSKGLAPVEDNNAIQKAIEYCENRSELNLYGCAYEDVKQFLENLNTK